MLSSETHQADQSFDFSDVDLESSARSLMLRKTEQGVTRASQTTMIAADSMSMAMTPRPPRRWTASWSECGTALYYSVEALARGMHLCNAALPNVCRERRVECLDAAEALPRRVDVFYDDAHFTEAGSEKLAGLLAEYLFEREAALRPGGG